MGYSPQKSIVGDCQGNEQNQGETPFLRRINFQRAHRTPGALLEVWGCEEGRKDSFIEHSYFLISFPSSYLPRFFYLFYNQVHVKNVRTNVS